MNKKATVIVLAGVASTSAWTLVTRENWAAVWPCFLLGKPTTSGPQAVAQRELKAHPDVQKLLDAARVRGLARETALATFKQARDKAIELKDRFGEGEGWHLEAVYRGPGGRQDSLDATHKGLAIYRELGARRQEAAALFHLGYVHGGMNQVRESLARYEEALPILREVGNRNMEGATLSNIGMCLGMLGRFEEAIKRSEEGLAIHRETGNKAFEANTLGNIALCLTSWGKPEESLKYNYQSIALHRELGNIAGERGQLSNLGITLNRLGRRDEALKLLEETLGFHRRVGDRAAEATVLGNLGIALAALNRPSDAIKRYEEAIALHRTLGNKRQFGGTLSNLAALLGNLGRNEEALKMLEEALIIHRESGSRDFEAHTTLNIGGTLHAMGRFPEALKRMEEALALYLVLRDRDGEGTAIANIGNILSALGRREEAILKYEEALRIHRERKSSARVAQALHVYGNTLAEIGRHAEAMKRYDEALVIFREINDKGSIGGLLNDVAGIFLNQGRYGDAFKKYEEALAVHREAKTRDFEGNTIHNIGLLLANLGRDEEAIKRYDEALKIAKEVGDAGAVTTFSGNRALSLLELDRDAEALQTLEESLRVSRELKSRPNEGSAQNYLGTYYLRRRRTDEAMRHFVEAKAIFEQTGSRKSLAGTLHNMANVLVIQRQFREALELYQQALPMHRETGARKFEGNTLAAMSSALIGMDSSEGAILFLKESVNVAQELRSGISKLDRETQQSFLMTVEDRYRRLADLLLAQGRILEAERVLAMLKEEEEFSFIRRDSESAKHFEAKIELVGREKGWWDKWQAVQLRAAGVQTEMEQLRRKKERTPADDARLLVLRDELNTVRKAVDTWVKQIETEVTQDRTREAQAARLRAEELGQSGRIDSILSRFATERTKAVAVYAIAGEDRLHLIVVRPEGRLAKSVEIKRTELDKLVGEFRQALMFPTLDPRPSGKKLYDLLVKPVDQLLKGAQAIWSLDGNLRYIPLCALWDGKAYLAERGGNTLFSPLSLDVLEGRTSAQSGVAGFASSKGGDGYSDLPFTGKELTSIRSVVPGKYYPDEEFTEVALQKELDLGERPILHLSTHFRLGKTIYDSALLVGKRATPQPLSSAGPRELTLSEMQNWSANLFGQVEVIVFSACSTARDGLTAESDGREVDSVASMAMRQGARTVIATLWDVADESTSALMAEFYRGWAKDGVSKAEALRRAQVALLSGSLRRQAPAAGTPADARSAKLEGSTATLPKFEADPKKPWSHPYYWAPFVLHGNWR